MKAICLMATMAAMLALAQAARADSIWLRARASAVNPASDNTARRVGDTITIVVNERSVINNNAERNMEKKSDRDLKVAGNVQWGSNSQTAAFSGDLSSSGDTKFDGTAKYQNDRQVTDAITVVVEDVLPNGNLVVLGWRQRDIDGDKEIIQISGIVRPIDVSFENTIRSEQVGDFRMVYHFKGRDSNFTKPNWLDSILNVVSPF